MNGGRKSRRGSEVNAVLMRRQSLSFNREQEREGDYYFLMCKNIKIMNFQSDVVSLLEVI